MLRWLKCSSDSRAWSTCRDTLVQREMDIVLNSEETHLKFVLMSGVTDSVCVCVCVHTTDNALELTAEQHCCKIMLNPYFSRYLAVLMIDYIWSDSYFSSAEKPVPESRLLCTVSKMSNVLLGSQPNGELQEPIMKSFRHTRYSNVQRLGIYCELRRWKHWFMKVHFVFRFETHQIIYFSLLIW